MGGQLGASAGLGQDSGEESSTTLAGVSGIVGNKDARTGDAESGIQKIFDAESVQKDINAQVKITQMFNQLAPKAAATYASNKANTLKKQAETEQDPEQKTALLDEAKKWEPNGDYNIAMNIVIGAAGGGTIGAASSATKESLSWAADQMRQAMIEDSKKFPGICVSKDDCISNISGKSIGVNGDGVKVAGGRIILADWCEKGGAGSCVPDSSTKSGYKENADGTVAFRPVNANGNSLSIREFINQHQELRSPLGGVQGGSGQMALGIQFEYAVNSFWDKLAEAYAGTHDNLNSFIWYDGLGNGKNLDKTMLGKIGDAANYVNVLNATPFALSVLLPPEVWNSVFMLIKIR